MKTYNRLILIFTILTIFFIFSFIIFNDFRSKKHERTIFSKQTILNQTPIGELTNDISFEQSIKWGFIGGLKPGELENICINLLMANYGNQKTTGAFFLNLRTEDFSKKIIFDAHSVQDNSSQRFCYNNIPLTEIIKKPTTLILEGINSPPGRAVTAWATSDTSQGRLSRNGMSLNSSLIFSIVIISETDTANIQIIIFILICGLNILMLFLPIKS